MTTHDEEIRLLRERWEGEEARIRKILVSIKAEEDWTIHLEGLQFVDQISVAEREKYGRDLRGVVLSGANLRWADLNRVYLAYADLRYADLCWAGLSHADLMEANLCEALVFGANLSRSKLVAVDLNRADLNEADLRCADLRAADLSRADLNFANLCEADLRNADFSGVDLCRSDLSGVNLSVANLIGANLRGTNLCGADLIQADLSETDLSNANLKGAKLNSANLENADVSGVEFNRRGRYRGIRVATCYGSQSFKRFAQDQDFIEEFRSIRWRKYIFYYPWLILADCGRSLGLWAAWSVVMAFFFAAIYFYSIGPDAFRFDSNLPHTFWTFLYYSVVTFTTLGFGDLTPDTPYAA